MSKNLLIVESPAKARTISKYLGPDFTIMASVGHLKDLPVNKLGVELGNNFKPEYVTIKGKGKILKALKDAGGKSDVIYLAPDPDREGEAIAWHIAQELKQANGKIFRVLFNELTKKAIKAAVNSPTELDRYKFESQQARRILDRIVGYQISPLLWSRVKRGLSAGRVQSVSVKMICEREREIHAFERQEYWSLTAHLKAEDPPPFESKLTKYMGKKVDLKNEEQTNKIVLEVEKQDFKVAKVIKKKKKRTPPPPFTTSLLQQNASSKLGFSAKKTMSVAQGLYEGVALGDRGQTGLITYMRTDSFRISQDAVSQARDYIRQAFGKDYLPAKPNHYKSRKGAQEAHEAIRPTLADLDPKAISAHLTRDQLVLYSLIWKRFIACQMNPAIIDQTQIEITAGKAVFKASGSIVVFNGFIALYEKNQDGSGPEKDQEGRLPPIKTGQTLALIKLDPAQHFTQPPPRYTEATLIKALEENGIGRPSTYAAILANISGREYVSIEKRHFKPTELGFLVTDLLINSFPDIMDTAFTAQMESNLDKVEQGEEKWTDVLVKFYRSFELDLEKAKKGMNGEVLTDIICPKCSSKMAIKSGRNGLFLACTGYPQCKQTANFTRDEKGKVIVEEVPEAGKEIPPCEKCGQGMVVKNGKFGPFLACSGYPECNNTRPLEPSGAAGPGAVSTDVKCKACGARMVIKMSRFGQRFLACEEYPKCTYTEPISTNIPCPNENCSGTLVERSSKKGRKFYSCNRYPECRFAMWDEPYDDVCPQCGTKVLSIKKHQKGTETVLACRKKGCDFKKGLPSS